jgi:hypothetical protein
MLNELQVKLLDKGEWPNRVWMSLHGKWDVKTPYHNRRQRNAARNAKKPYDYLQKIFKDGKLIKVIKHLLPHDERFPRRK